jgi:hypothetical protein
MFLVADALHLRGIPLMLLLELYRNSDVYMLALGGLKGMNAIYPEVGILKPTALVAGFPGQ